MPRIFEFAVGKDYVVTLKNGDIWTGRIIGEEEQKALRYICLDRGTVVSLFRQSDIVAAQQLGEEGHAAQLL